jgi:hypothetical protein
MLDEKPFVNSCSLPRSLLTPKRTQRRPICHANCGVMRDAQHQFCGQCWTMTGLDYDGQWRGADSHAKRGLTDYSGTCTQNARPKNTCNDKQTYVQKKIDFVANP